MGFVKHWKKKGARRRLSEQVINQVPVLPVVLLLPAATATAPTTAAVAKTAVVDKPPTAAPDAAAPAAGAAACANTCEDTIKAAAATRVETLKLMAYPFQKYEFATPGANLTHGPRANPQNCLFI
jgi:hypothetical protein